MRIPPSFVRSSTCYCRINKSRSNMSIAKEINALIGSRMLISHYWLGSILMFRYRMISSSSSLTISWVWPDVHNDFLILFWLLPLLVPKRTKSFMLTIPMIKLLEIVGYSNSDIICCLNGKRSSLDYIFMLAWSMGEC